MNINTHTQTEFEIGSDFIYVGNYYAIFHFITVLAGITV